MCRSVLAVTAALTLACAAGAANGQALGGKVSDFKHHAHAMFRDVDAAIVASQCGLRTEDWRGHVGSAVWRRVRTMSGAVWSDPHAASRKDALIRLFGDMNDRLQLTLSRMTSDDCETLRSSPGRMKALDRLAQEAAGETKPSWEEPNF